MDCPQPLGDYLELANHLDQINAIIQSGSNFSLDPFPNAESLSKICMLVVDPGENTLDWLLVDQGRINTKASGATSDAGRHRIVRAVAEALSASIGAPITPSNLPRINESLRNGTKFRHMGTAHNLEIYEPVMRAAVEDPINRLIEGLKGLEDRIDLIGVVGGHPAMYAAELQKRFPNVPVFTSPASLYANLRGFQAVAQSTAQRLTQAA